METRGKKHEEKNPVGDKPDRFFLVVLVPLGQYRTDQRFGCSQRANECGHDEGLLVHHVPLRISQYRNMLNHVKLEDHIQIANLSRHHSALASKTNKNYKHQKKSTFYLKFLCTSLERAVSEKAVPSVNLFLKSKSSASK